jgi:cytidine deaminase
MQQYSFAYQVYAKGELPTEIEQLVAAANTATAKAYAPYSNLKVGAAILMTDGNIITGANQENAAYPNGICAERSALAHVHIDSESPKVKAIAVTYSGKIKNPEKPIAPCGMCRQNILETQHRQQAPIAVYMCSPSGQVLMIEDAEHLLPFSFGSDNLPFTDPPGVES